MASLNALAILRGLAGGAVGHQTQERELAEQLRQEQERFRQTVELQELLAGLREKADIRGEERRAGRLEEEDVRGLQSELLEILPKARVPGAKAVKIEENINVFGRDELEKLIASLKGAAATIPPPGAEETVRSEAAEATRAGKEAEEDRELRRRLTESQIGATEALAGQRGEPKATRTFTPKQRSDLLADATTKAADNKLQELIIGALLEDKRQQEGERFFGGDPQGVDFQDLQADLFRDENRAGSKGAVAEIKWKGLHPEWFKAAGPIELARQGAAQSVEQRVAMIEEGASDATLIAFADDDSEPVPPDIQAQVDSATNPELRVGLQQFIEANRPDWQTIRREFEALRAGAGADLQR